MPDRTAASPRPPFRPLVPEPVVEEAVFEEVDFGRPSAHLPLSAAPEPPNDLPTGGDGRAPWGPLPDYRPAGASASTPERPHPSGDAAPFRIDFEDAPARPSTALVPLALPAPVAAPGGGPPAPPPAPPPPRAEARRVARDKAQMLRRHWPLVLAGLLAGAGLAALYNALAPTRYEATSVLLVRPPAVGGPQAALGSGFADAPGRDGSQVLNQALILEQAPQIAEQTAETLLARPDAARLWSVGQAARRTAAPVTVAALATTLREDVLTVAPAGDRVDAVRITASTGDADEAALVAGLYTDVYQRVTRETNLARVLAARDQLAEQVGRRQSELDALDGRLSAYLTRHNAAGLDAQAQTAVSQVGTLQQQLDLAGVSVRTYEAQLRQLQADLASAGPRLQASTAAPSAVETTALDTQIAELESLVEQVYLRNPDLRGRPDAHPDLAAMTRRLDGLRQERQRVRQGAAGTAMAAGGLSLAGDGANGAAYLADVQRQISQTRAALEGARAQVAALSSRLGEARGQMRALPAQQVDVDALRRRRAAAEQTLLGLQRELDLTEVAATSELGLTQTIREPRVPERPVSPRKGLNLALGLLLGLLTGLGLAAVRFRTDARVHTPADLEEHGFAVVGTIPDLGAALREGRFAAGGASVGPGVVTLARAFSPEAESFRHLHATLSASADAPHVVLVGGPDVGAGKTLVAANLAVAAAQAGRRVLLVDADLRTPAVAELFGLGAAPPLGEGPEGTNLVYWSTAIPSLFAMTPREAAVTPEQLWAPHLIGRLLANLREAFDLIVIDAPPALVAADAALLAPHADAALLVAVAGQTDLDALAQVAGELAGVGLERVGAVLNRFSPRRAVGYGRTAAVRHTARRSA